MASVVASVVTGMFVAAAVRAEWVPTGVGIDVVARSNIVCLPVLV